MLVCHYWVVAQSKSKIAVSSNASSPFTNDTSGPALSSAQCPEISGYTEALLHPDEGICGFTMSGDNLKLFPVGDVFSYLCCQPIITLFLQFP
jgi:hypothetical protein